MKAFWRKDNNLPATLNDDGILRRSLPLFFVLLLSLMVIAAGCSFIDDLGGTTSTTETADQGPQPEEQTTTSTSVDQTTTTKAATTTTAAETTTTTEEATATTVEEPSTTTATDEPTTTTEPPATPTTLALATADTTESTLAPEATEPPETTTTTVVPGTTTTVTEPPTTEPPTTTEEEPAPKVLYAIDEWIEGTQDWAAAGQWDTVDGMLVADGTSDSFAIAPTDLAGHPDYVVECEIQILDPDDDISVMLTARMINGTGYWAGFGGIDDQLVIGYDEESLVSLPFVLDDRWHTYRLEVRGNQIRLFLGQAEVLRVTDNHTVDPGTVAIYCANCQINVRSYRVLAL